MDLYFNVLTISDIKFNSIKRVCFGKNQGAAKKTLSLTLTFYEILVLLIRGLNGGTTLIPTRRAIKKILDNQKHLAFNLLDSNHHHQ
jgi:hypothetical protein